jgi:Rrf2 family iron-sulfur cluster assembly transcriptional regulator
MIRISTPAGGIVMISKKTKKAVDVCIYLCDRRTHSYVTATEMAPDLGLSVSHLENILKPLRDRGIVTSTRGPGGGYAISEAGLSQSVWDVVVIFEDALAHTAPGDSSEADAVASYELGLEQAIQANLSNFKLGEVNASWNVATDAAPRRSGRFKLKPLRAPARPRAANSVFEWHMMITGNALSEAR